MKGRARNGAPASAPLQSKGGRAAPDGAPRSLLHELQNTLSAINLRLGVLAADPTCRWAQEENIEALRRITADAMTQAGRLRDAVLGGDGVPRQRRKNAAGPAAVSPRERRRRG